jgi:large subunit ribosomal protein L21
MYAVFVDGSRQYRVSEGDLVKVDFRDAEDGARVEFPRVLLYRNGDELKIGQPVLDGMRVVAEVTEQTSTKYVIQHFRRRKNYRRLKGHTQPYTYVRIQHILMPGQPIPEPAPKPAPEASTPAPTPEPAPAPATT